jgi:lysophospholipase L1-like esterase
VDLVDLELGDRPDRELQHFFSEDGYHPSDAGYAAWAGVIWEAVRARIPSPARLAATPA